MSLARHLRVNARPSSSGMYFPALDGVRAIAVLAVIAFHADQSWARGGFLGVEVFFVVSGFLITRLLVIEAEQTGRVDVIGFWKRRARRLLPALFATLAVVAIWMLLVHRDEIGGFRRDFVAALAYVTNWFQIATDESYFTNLGRPSPLRHLWSLAVEEQFYLLWPPLLLVLALVAKGRRRWMAAIFLLLALASAGLMALLFNPDRDPNRVYLGTDTRLSGLFLGAAFGLVWRRSHMGSRSGVTLIAVVSASALGALIWVFAEVSETSAQLYRGGFLAVDVATILVLAASTLDSGAIRSLLAWNPLQAIGRRSYGLYLWHWPVLVLTDPTEDAVVEGAGLWLLRGVLTIALTEGSYRFVEMPVRNGATARWWERMRRGGFRQRGRAVLPAVGSVLVGALLTVAVVAQPARPNDIVASITEGQDFLNNLSTTSTAATTTTTTLPATTTTIATGDSTIVADPAATTVAPTTVTTVPPPPPPPPPPLIAIGDSVMLGAAPALVGQFGDRVTVDARVSRGFSEGIRILQAHKDAGTLTPVVVVHLGNNGPVSDAQFEELMAVLAEVRSVVITTVRVNRKWQNPVNDTLRGGAARHPNVTVFDWFTATEGQKALFYSDGTHLRKDGAEQYAGLLQTLVDTVTAPPPTTTVPPTTAPAPIAPAPIEPAPIEPAPSTPPDSAATTVAPPTDPAPTSVAAAGDVNVG